MIKIYLKKLENINDKKIIKDSLYKELFINKEDIIHNEKGKPYLKNNDFYFNYSDSKEYIGIAKSKKEIGFDIERKRVLNSSYLSRLRNKILNESDIKDNSIIDSNAILKIWTIKEAYLKYLGIGLTFNPNEIIIDYSLNVVKFKSFNVGYFKTFDNCDIIYTVVIDSNDEVVKVEE